MRGAGSGGAGRQGERVDVLSLVHHAIALCKGDDFLTPLDFSESLYALVDFSLPPCVLGKVNFSWVAGPTEGGTVVPVGLLEHRVPEGNGQDLSVSQHEGINTHKQQQ